MLKLSISVIGSLAILLATTAAHSEQCRGNTKVDISSHGLHETATGGSSISMGSDGCTGDSTVVTRTIGNKITDGDGRSTIMEGSGGTVYTD